MPAPAGIADVCLEIASSVLPDGGQLAVSAALADVVATRSTLFPQPTVRVSSGVASERLDIHAGHAGAPTRDGAPCLDASHDWTAFFARSFLEASAELMLEQAARTPGFTSSVSIEWFPDEDRVRTTLTFAGPLDIPNGTCWVDDVLSIESEAALAVASGERGLRTSPFGEGVCDRFYDNLPDGGAGEQAVTLLPALVDLAEGNHLRFAAEDVTVEADGIRVSGRLEVG